MEKYNEISNSVYLYTSYKSAYINFIAGALFDISEKYNLMKKYYKIAAKKGNNRAINRLGVYHHNITKKIIKQKNTI